MCSVEMEANCRIGELPSFWDRRVLFFANLLSLFFGNDVETAELRRTVGTLGTYGGRLLPILNLLFRRRPNVLVLDRRPDPDMVSLFRDRLQLSLPEVMTLKREDYCSFETGHLSPAAQEMADLLIDHKAEWVDGFVTDKPLQRLAEFCNKSTICTLTASRRGNNKVLLHQELQEVDLPTFDTVMLENATQVESGAIDLRNKGYRYAVVKSPIGASGIGLLKVDLSALVPVPAYMFYEGPCLLQGWLNDHVNGVQCLGSPSVQLFLQDERLCLFDLTDQILGAESVHEGNVAPPPFVAGEPGLKNELLAQAEVAGEWLLDQGYRGTASVDFHVVRRNGAFEVRVCEINARVTGATYPAVLAGHLAPGCAWLMRNLCFSKPLSGGQVLRALEQRRLLFDRGCTEGVCPINFNLDAAGMVVKGQFLCVAESVEKTQELLKNVRRWVPEAEYDRD